MADCVSHVWQREKICEVFLESRKKKIFGVFVTEEGYFMLE